MKTDTLTHAEYCRNKEARLGILSRLCFNEFAGFYWLNYYGGNWITDAELEAVLPINSRLITWKQKKHNKGKNPNRKFGSLSE